MAIEDLKVSNKDFLKKLTMNYDDLHPLMN